MFSLPARLHGVGLALALALTCVGAQTTQNPILDPANFTTWDGTSSDGLSRRASINVPFVNTTGADDNVMYWRADLVGNAQQRGFAQGELFAAEISTLYYKALPEFFVDMVNSLDLSMLPPALAAIIYQGLDAHVTDAFYRAMDWVWAQESAFVPPRLLTEMDAIGAGVCSGLAAAATSRGAEATDCDPAAWAANIQQINMLPELIKMTCTMFGERCPHFYVLSLGSL